MIVAALSRRCDAMNRHESLRIERIYQFGLCNWVPLQQVMNGILYVEALGKIRIMRHKDDSTAILRGKISEERADATSGLSI